MKTCSKCRSEMPRTEFYKNSRAKDGLGSWCKACHRRYNAKNNSQRTQKQRRLEQVKRHGLTVARYQELLVRQCNHCAICREWLGDDVAIDHDHECCPKPFSCGKCVRGLVHRQCNRAIGLFGDDPTTLQNAVHYLRSFKGREVLNTRDGRTE